MSPFLLALLLVPAAAADPRPLPPSAEQRTALVWGGELFVTRTAFDGWLRRHSERFDTWSALHPVARAILASAIPDPPQFRPTPAGVAARPVAASHAQRAAGATNWTLLGLAIGAAALLVLSAAPVRRFAPNPEFGEFVEERRVAVSAIAIGLLIGVGVARLLT